MKFAVKDCMTVEVKSVSPDMNAKDALNLLLTCGLSGLPVIDSDRKAVGVFTEREVLKSVLPVYLKDVGDFVYDRDFKTEIKKMAGLEKMLVKDIMRKEVPTIDEEASIAEASRMMLTKSERRLIALKGGKVAGLITRSDVVKTLARTAGLNI